MMSFGLRWVFAAMAALGLAFTLDASAGTVIVYSNDFETNTNGFNSSSRASLPTDDQGVAGLRSMHLGRFANNSVTLSLSGLTAGMVYTVAFDLFIGASWDGNNTDIGPDRWTLTADGTALVNTTFASGGGIGQSYSDTHPIGRGSYAFQTGADVAVGPDKELDVFRRYAIYYFSHGAGNPILTFTASGATASLVFAGSNLQGVEDEFWALDNVVVTTSTGSPAVPEPSALVLALTAAGALGCLRLRRG